MISSAKIYTKINIKIRNKSVSYSKPQVYSCSQSPPPQFGMIRCLFRYSTDAGTSSWLWSFNPLLLRLLGEISLSHLCSHSSWGSALDLDPPLHVGRLRASVPHPDRTGLKEQLLRGLWLTQAAGREGYGGGGASLQLQRRRDVAAAQGAPCVLPGKLFPDHGTLAVAGCTGSREGRCGE